MVERNLYIGIANYQKIDSKERILTKYSTKQM